MTNQNFTRAALHQAAEGYEEVTITRTLDGDAEAGREALRLCCSALTSGKLSRELADYLADRLEAVDAALKESDERPPKTDRYAPLAAALKVKRSPGRPATLMGEWQTEYAAYAELLRRRNFTPADIRRELVKLRLKVDRRSFDERAVTRVIGDHKPLRRLPDGYLHSLCLRLLPRAGYK